MSKFNDTILYDSQNGAWKGIGDYFVSDGMENDFMNSTDHWGGCKYDEPESRCPVGGYVEFTERESTGGFFGDNNFLVFEPCNYTSNISFLHSATRICDNPYPYFTMNDEYQNAFKRSFFSLAVSSSFHHASHTYAGYAYDNRMIELILYMGH